MYSAFLMRMVPIKVGWPRRAVLAAIVVGLVPVLASCSSSSPDGASKGKLAVVAAESPWGAVATAIGGRHAQVISVIANPNVDPHEYTPTAQVAAEVAQASVVIDNGLGYDSFMDGLLSTGASHARSVVTAATVLGLHGAGSNPHLWYALDRVPQVAEAIEASFAAADPSHRASYAQNLERFDRSLSSLTSALGRIRATRRGTPVAQTERVAGYLLAQAGLVVASPRSFSLAIEAGQEPDAQATTQMNDVLVPRRVAVLLENTETISPVTNDVVARARQARIAVVGVSELVEPQGATFVSWQARQIAALSSALGLRSTALSLESAGS